MVRDLLGALTDAPVQHVALVTGLKHYLGPFEAYAAGEMPDTPFHEDEPRLPVDNFYYAQEDELWAAAARQGFTWSVHRSHTVFGHAVGNAMNMGQTLAAQATICRELGLPFVFPGSETQWNGLTDMTDAGVLAEHLVWAATAPAAATRRSTSSTATSSAGVGCGPRSRPTSGSKPRASLTSLARSSSRWPAGKGCEPTPSPSTDWPRVTSPESPPGGTPTPTSAVTSRSLPT